MACIWGVLQNSFSTTTPHIFATDGTYLMPFANYRTRFTSAPKSECSSSELLLLDLTLPCKGPMYLRCGMVVMHFGGMSVQRLTVG